MKNKKLESQMPDIHFLEEIYEGVLNCEPRQGSIGIFLLKCRVYLDFLLNDSGDFFSFFESHVGLETRNSTKILF